MSTRGVIGEEILHIDVCCDEPRSRRCGLARSHIIGVAGVAAVPAWNPLTLLHTRVPFFGAKRTETRTQRIFELLLCLDIQNVGHSEYRSFGCGITLLG